MKPQRNLILESAVRAALAGSVFLLPSGIALAQDGTSAVAKQRLDEVVVTAQRREENIQSVPIAITAFDSNSLREQNISSVNDLNGKVPGVTVNSAGMMRNAEVVTIRGQGQTYLSPVGVVNYFAEVPLIQGTILPTQGGSGSFFDLESLQVLRGPQGTLFGRNTTGGAVLLGPKKPSMELEGYLQGQAGNYNDREYEGGISIPLIENTLSVRLSAKDVERDGFTKDVGPGPYGYSSVCQPAEASLCNAFAPGDRSPGFKGKDYDNVNYWHARIGVLWRPTEAIENYFVAYKSKSSDNGSGFVLDGLNTGPTIANIAANTAYRPDLFFPVVGNIFDPAVGQGILDAQNRLGPRKVAMNIDQFTDIEAKAYINTFSWDLSENMTLRNILSYQTQKINYAWDLDGSIIPILAQLPPEASDPRNQYASPGEKGNISDSEQTTVELQLQGNALSKKLDYVMGMFYSDFGPNGYQQTGSHNVANLSVDGGYEIDITSKAAYAQGTLNLGEFSDALQKFKVTAGARYTEDETKASRQSTNFFSDRVYYGPGMNDYDLPGRKEELKSEKVTWTLGLDYQMTDNVLLYGKVTKGYKAGAFNYAAPRQLTAKPEEVMNYELGVKTDFVFASMPTRLNANLFMLDYDDIQRAAGDNVGIGAFQLEEYDRNGDGDIADFVCVGPSGENYAASRTCLDQGAITFNADSARISGVELEAAIEPIDNLSVSMSYSYMDSEYRKYKLTVYPDPIYAGQTVHDCDGAVTIPAPGQPAAQLDLSCIPFQNTPKHIAALNTRYTIPLSIGGEVAILASANYRGEQYNGSTSASVDDPRATIGGYTVYNASVEWNRVAGSGVDIRAFVDNLTDKVYRSHAYPGLNSSSGFTNSLYGAPRMYGLALRYRFGAQ